MNQFKNLNLDEKKNKELSLIKNFEKKILNNCQIKYMQILKYILNNNLILLKIKNEKNDIYHISLIYNNKLEILKISYKFPMLDNDQLHNF
jgi:hypothetical protein